MKRLSIFLCTMTFLIIFQYSQGVLDKNIIKRQTRNILARQKVLNTLLLRYASTCNRQKMMELISKGAHINTYDTNKNTSLMLAILNNNIECAALLLQAGADINMQNNQGQTVLHIALQWERNDIVSLLMEYNPSMTLKDNKGQTTLDLLGNPLDLLSGTDIQNLLKPQQKRPV